MIASVEYLEAAKIEEVAEKLRDQGYEVILQPQAPYEGYDLIATKGDKKLAVEVTVNTQLRESIETIKTLRKRAIVQGIDEFQLVVVSPPREVDVEIEGLETELRSALLRYLITNKESIDKLRDDSEHINIQRITQVDIRSVEIANDGIRVTGDGVVEVSIHPLSVGDSPPLKYSWGMPFNFDVKLGHDLKISEVYTLAIDQSAFED